MTDSEVHNPYAVTPRQRLTDKQRLQLFIERQGICCICRTKVRPPHERWIDEHVEPLWLTGLNCWSNRDVAHELCARAKTAKEATMRARVRSIAERHFGAKRSDNPLPGGRGSKWKRKMNGKVVLRDEEG